MSEIVGIDLNIQSNPKETFTLSQFHSLFTHSAATLKDEHIGLHVSQAFRISTFPGPSQILAVCKDIEQAMHVGQRYANLVHNLGFPHLEKFGDPAHSKAKFIWLPSYEKLDAGKYRHITEYVMGNYVMSVNWLAWGFGQGIKKVSFAHQQNAALAEYERIFGCEVEFGAEHHEIRLCDDVINQPLPNADRNKLALYQARLEQILASQNKDNGLILKVERNIRATIEIRRPSLPLVASQLAMNERTLRRGLKAQGTTFARVLEKVKKDLCQTFLQEQRPYADIAQLLWYSEQSAFTRAFKKWYGVTPKNHKP
ncbi:MAG: helix-turn-helix domain-containing protein [Hyphomonadaceae bacterium]|nr:helix-turn-helix domain-containing protein [Hyphomonadaceae bacterium]